MVAMAKSWRPPGDSTASGDIAMMVVAAAAPTTQDTVRKRDWNTAGVAASRMATATSTATR